MNRSMMRSILKSDSCCSEQSVSPSLDHLFDLILDLNTAVDTSHKRSVGALRKLFVLSEDVVSNNRTEMVRTENEALIPALFQFFSRCDQNSVEQYLVLLILNNLSIPAKNKKLIALKYDGAKILANALCQNPSCHYLAIILVNFTFSDEELRQEVLSDESGVGLVESLGFALRVSSLTIQELGVRREFIEEVAVKAGLSPVERLSLLMAEDYRLRIDEKRRGIAKRASIATKHYSQQSFPETARWCLSAIKNLTRPSKDAAAAHVLIKTGVLDLILEYITTPKNTGVNGPWKSGECGSPTSISSDDTPTADPLDIFENTPNLWSPNSVQDLALHIVLNLAACPVSRDYVFEANAVTALTSIATFSRTDMGTERPNSQQEYQALKARMSLALLLRSQGHFGQAKITSKTSTIEANPEGSPIIMNDADCQHLIEMLLNVLHRRGKSGPGGYSATAFDLHSVVFALRCLLTHTTNQARIAFLLGRGLNLLLLKLLAQFSLQRVPWMNMETAEHAVFCLYLQSNYGFENPFLPAKCFDEGQDTREVAAKALKSYLTFSTPTTAGRHAAEQLLLRIPYLIFEGKLPDDVGPSKLADFDFGQDLRLQLSAFYLGEMKAGAEPRKDIFRRVVTKARKPEPGKPPFALWHTKAAVSVFPSALQAAQQFSYGSIRVRHVDHVDDINIANNIARSACGEKAESYGFMWAWEETKAQISPLKLERQSSFDSLGSLFREVSTRLDRSAERKSAFSFNCGPLCNTDTTI